MKMVPALLTSLSCLTLYTLRENLCWMSLMTKLKKCTTPLKSEHCRIKRTKLCQCCVSARGSCSLPSTQALRYTLRRWESTWFPSATAPNEGLQPCPQSLHQLGCDKTAAEYLQFISKQIKSPSVTSHVRAVTPCWQMVTKSRPVVSSRSALAQSAGTHLFITSAFILKVVKGSRFLIYLHSKFKCLWQVLEPRLHSPTNGKEKLRTWKDLYEISDI